MDVPTPASKGADTDWPPWVRKVVLPYLTDFALWPVTFAVLAHAALLGALVVLLTWRSGTPLAWGFLILSVVVTLTPVRLELRYDRRFGPVTLTMLVLWAMTAVLAWWGGANGYF
jgi:hypothetical protein